MRICMLAVQNRQVEIYTDVNIHLHYCNITLPTQLRTEYTHIRFLNLAGETESKGKNKPSENCCKYCKIHLAHTNVNVLYLSNIYLAHTNINTCISYSGP